MNHTKVRIDKQVVFNAQSTTQKLGQTDKQVVFNTQSTTQKLG